MKKCVLIISHGSREKSANLEFKRLVRKYQARHPHWHISYAYLEMAPPSIPEALKALALKASEILVLPFFLFTARHVKKHIPKILRTFRKSHQKITIKLGKPLGADSKLLGILDQRMNEMMD
jgi:sirohydrochlorin ferrochelatase